MRKMPEFISHGRIWVISMFFVVTSAAMAQFGVVGGQVMEAERNGIPNMLVHLIHESGEEKQMRTDENGSFFFENLTEGPYTLKVDERHGWVTVSPQSGQYEFYLDRFGMVELDFLMTRSGVTIDFGKPPTNGGGTMNKFYDQNGAHDSVLIRLNGTKSISGEKPNTLRIEGRLSLKGDPNATIRIIGATPIGAYANGVIQLQHLGQNRFKLAFQSSGWPGLAFDGAVMQLQFEIRSDLGDESGPPRLKIQTSSLILGYPSNDYRRLAPAEMEWNITSPRK